MRRCPPYDAPCPRSLHDCTGNTRVLHCRTQLPAGSAASPWHLCCAKYARPHAPRRHSVLVPLSLCVPQLAKPVPGCTPYSTSERPAAALLALPAERGAQLCAVCQTNCLYPDQTWATKIASPKVNPL